MTAPDAVVITTGPPRILSLIFLEFEQPFRIWLCPAVPPFSETVDCDQSIGAAVWTITGTIRLMANRNKAEFRCVAHGESYFHIT